MTGFAFDQSGSPVLEVQAWSVVFLAGPRRWWWDWLCDRRFRHCAAYGWSGDAQCWVIVDPCHAGMHVMAASQEGLERWLTWQGANITAIVQSRVAGSVGGLRLGLWCAPVVSYLLGRRRGALRPQALWRDLVRDGGEVIVELRDANVGKGPRRKPA